eukprot:CAMPEP_0197925732 /NCGR_PEP_ID=MMETSP1439-20131203/97974_1 /TAXON_ID=66791 /ORGANISM="Gonyaulax spinifera, Strain CCMP409" /LENGTH=90 /DNA_ID=CAMNT_0043548229 /DNA_START=24 /DNA_END=293 /DNA_ORIENTATION=-
MQPVTMLLSWGCAWQPLHGWTALAEDTADYHPPEQVEIGGVARKLGVAKKENVLALGPQAWPLWRAEVRASPEQAWAHAGHRRTWGTTAG